MEVQNARWPGSPCQSVDAGQCGLRTLTLQSRVDAQMLSRDPYVADAFVNDPLVHTEITAGWGKALLQAFDLAYKQAPNFPVPLLLMHGDEDQIAYPEGSRIYAGR
jgi:acylglycerol lipase